MFCLPRPGESEVRTESYSQTKYGPDGVSAIGQYQITRCMECACMSVDGGPSDDPPCHAVKLTAARFS